MRAKIASRTGGHALEKRFLDLDVIQLSLLYRQAQIDEINEKKENLEVIKILNESWTKKFQTLFNNLQMFVNPEMFKRLEEYKDLEKHRDEISEDNFMDEWEKMMDVIPEEFVVEENVQAEVTNLPAVDETMEELITGWVSRHSNILKEGD